MVLVLLSTLPQANGGVATKKHIEDVFHIVCDFKSKPHANYSVPCWAKLLVHGVFDHLGRTLVVGTVLLAGGHAQLHRLHPHLLVHVRELCNGGRSDKGYIRLHSGQLSLIFTFFSSPSHIN